MPFYDAQKPIFTFIFCGFNASDNLILTNMQSDLVISAVARQDSSPSLTVNRTVFGETCHRKLYFYECVNMFKETAVVMLFL